jgi:hypothetical protein
MSYVSLPLSHLSYFARRVQASEASNIESHWTGDDEKGRRSHHGIIALSKSPLRLHLSWRRSSRDSMQIIGIFELDLWKLLEASYIRVESGTEGEIRLRFYHGLDDVIYIQVNMKGPGLPIGQLS